MINIGFELQQIEQSLFNQTGLYNTSRDKVDYLRNLLDSAIAGIVRDFLSQAVDHAEDLKAYDFAELVDIREMHDGVYEITTINGQTDFSVPEIKMLPHLLKNAKTSKDGTMYKVIPISDGPSTPSRSTSVFDVLKERQELLDQKRADILEKKNSLQQSIADMRSGLRGNKANPPYQPKTREGETHFVTATSKQDPNVDWVIPKKDKDMTSFLSDLNHRMASELENVIASEIQSFKIQEGVI